MRSTQVRNLKKYPRGTQSVKNNLYLLWFESVMEAPAEEAETAEPAPPIAEAPVRANNAAEEGADDTEAAAATPPLLEPPLAVVGYSTKLSGGRKPVALHCLTLQFSDEQSYKNAASLCDPCDVGANGRIGSNGCKHLFKLAADAANPARQKVSGKNSFASKTAAQDHYKIVRGREEDEYKKTILRTNQEIERQSKLLQGTVDPLVSEVAAREVKKLTGYKLSSDIKHRTRMQALAIEEKRGIQSGERAAKKRADSKSKKRKAHTKPDASTDALVRNLMGQ